MKEKRMHVIYGALISMLFLCSSIFSFASEENPINTGEVFFYTGSPLVLSNGEVGMLDAKNPDIGAIVVNERTYLPLRAVSEYFGAEASYNQEGREAVIQYGGKRYVFPIGSKKFILESGLIKKEYGMDSQTLILDGRTMVPLRAICENVLAKKVAYYNRVIAVADYQVKLQSNSGLMEEVEQKIGEAVKAGTMKDLKLALSGGQTIRYFLEDTVNDFAAGEQKSSAVMNTPADFNESYSKTNTQVEGIDEADIVKTDGKYIYIGGNNVVRIVGAAQGKLSDDTAIRLATNKTVNEIYVADNRLVILGTKWEAANQVDVSNSEGKTIGIVPPYYRQKQYSFVDIYDITDPLKPMYIKGHEMEGFYQTSRKNGNIVYLVTNMNSYGDIVLPMMKDTVAGNKEVQLDLNDVMIMTRHPSSGYIILSAININDEENTKVEAITAYGMTMYMNDSAMYFAVESSDNKSSIIKFALEGMKVGYAGSGEVKGHLLNQFAMDEFEGNLRVATTTWDRDNALYVLDPSLNIIGSVTGLAKGESIYSVRFIGSRGYIVTFRTIDPLFVFDLSDPKKPTVTGELKIPGFSNYLHPLNESMILGIGADTYEIYRKDNQGKDVVIGTRQGGIKYSIFDVSDMGKPKEVSKLVVGDTGSYSDAFYNHKAIMVDLQTENVALDAYLSHEEQERPGQQGALVVGFDGGELTLKGILDSEPSGVYGNDIPNARRILSIGNQLYYVQDGRITSYEYSSLKKIDDLVLQ